MSMSGATLIENKNVKQIELMGLLTQALAGEEQGLKTLEVRLLNIPPGQASPPGRHHGEVVCLTLKGIGRVAIGEHDLVDVFPHTTLVIPPHVFRQVQNTGEEDLEILLVRSMVSPRKGP